MSLFVRNKKTTTRHYYFNNENVAQITTFHVLRFSQRNKFYVHKADNFLDISLEQAMDFIHKLQVFPVSP